MDNAKDLDQKLGSFWQWFSENAERFIDLKPYTPDWTELDDAIHQLDIPSWEVGPTDNGGWFLALSPGGDRQRLEDTIAVARSAPSIHGWTFFGSKPRKSWDRVFRWSSKLVRIDARSWRFAVYRYPDKMYEIILLGSIMEFKECDEMRKLANFVIESELGEELLLRSVAIIDVEDNPSEEMLDSTVLISDLQKTINQRESESFND